MRGFRPASALALAFALSACAALKPASGDAGESVAPSTPPPLPSQIQLTIVAPKELKTLLESYLDLARLAVVAPGEVLSETELRRLEAATPAQARGLLATEGYMSPEVTVLREPGAAGEMPRVRIEVKPGARSRIERVDLALHGPLSHAADEGDGDAREALAAWKAAWALPVGAAFTDSAWRSAKTAALARLHTGGYAAASWSGTSAQVDAETAKVRLVVVADSGPLFRTGALVIEGLERQDEASVRNLADFAEGTPATEALLLDYQERLQRAGLFDRVSVTMATDPESAEATTLTVRVGELPLQQATVGIGVSANTGPRVSVEHLHRRVFGERATMRNKLEVGRLRQAWEGELSSHTLPGLYRNLLGGAVERLESDTDRITSFRARIGRAYDGAHLDRLAFVEVERALVRPFATTLQTAPLNTDTSAATVNFHVTWRDVDSTILPTLGQSLALQSGVGLVRSSGGSSGGGGFARLHGRLYAWRPLGGNWYGQGRIELGQVFAPDAVNVPESQRFRAGGDESVRGYAYRSLTPSVNGVDVGGRVVGTASIEVARPVSAALPNVWGAVFIDAGRAAERWSGWRPAWGAGFGVRWRSPVGPLRVDLAYGEEVEKWRLHFSVGIAF